MVEVDVVDEIVAEEDDVADDHVDDEGVDAVEAKHQQLLQ